MQNLRTHPTLGTVVTPVAEKRRILLIDRDEGSYQDLYPVLKREGYEPVWVADAAAALARLERERFEIALIDRHAGSAEFLRKLRDRGGDLRVIVTSGETSVDAAVQAVEFGAFEYLPRPIRPDQLAFVLRKMEEIDGVARENVRLRREMAKEYKFGNLIAKSRQMQEIFNTIRKIADYKTTCLLMGESGTGKELIARAVHYNSSRSSRPFITVNCGAIPENLLESELFGHLKGSFTGAVRTKKGLFEEADSGTLFLDEIGELPLLLQVKILRALQEEEIRRVGDVSAIKVNVRIIAATVKDLATEVERGTFREDLFYRLNVLPITIPPLRSRKEDVPLLLDHFVAKYNAKLSLKVIGLDAPALKTILDHDWPGNVRELENTIERAMVLANGDRIHVEDLPLSVREPHKIGGAGVVYSDAEELSIKKLSRRMEEDLILKALRRSQGNRTQAAKMLEISHRALLYKIKQYKLEARLKATTS